MTTDIILWLILTGLFVVWALWPSVANAIHDYRWYRREEKRRARKEAIRQHPSNRP